MRVLLGCVLAAAQAAAGATPVPPYGAADFVPTPDTPIGFRADVNGWYPLADPPVEWWEGTPRLVKMPVGGNSGYNADAKPAPVWTTGDTRSKNILWKAPIPGWGDTQPIVVGPPAGSRRASRVITTCGPDVVVCYDGDTGKVLWRDRLKVMALPVLGADRRTVGPAPPAGKAEAEQTAWELARAMYFLRVQGGGGGIGGGGKGDFFEDDLWPKHRPLVAQCVARVRQWSGLLKADLPPALRKGMDDAAEVLQAVLNGSSAEVRQDAWQTFNRNNPYLEAFKRSCRVTTFICWQGHVGGAFSTPVSDGRLVVVCFAYGQFAAYDVATGRRVWAFRDALIPDCQYMNHGASPWMYRDLVVVRSADGQAIMGLDKATGAVRWETQIQMQPRGRGANHGNYITPVLMDVPVRGGGVRKVLVTQQPPVLDPLTGEVLGRLEIKGPKPRSDRGTMVGRDGLLFTGWGYDAAPSPTYGFRLSMDGGKLVIAKSPNLEGNQQRGSYGDSPLLFRPGAMVGSHAALYDPATGIQIYRAGNGGPGDGEGAPVVLAGDLLISRARQNSFNRTRQDFSALTAFWVSDARDPIQPRLLSGRNLLGNADLPADLIWDTYMQGFEKRRNVGCYLGIAPWFGCRVGGVVPHGRRLYIQSTQAMYCIGPAVLGTPGDEPKTVAAIRSARSAAELARYLTADSAQYRHEAVKRLAALGAQRAALDALRRLAEGDPYEEIRAAAVAALDAADPANRPGTALVRDNLAAGLKEYRWWIGETHDRLRSVILTVRAMGPAGREMLAREIAAAKDPAALAAWYHLAYQLNIDVPPATDRALKIVADARADRGLAEQCGAYLAHTAWRDGRVPAALRRSPVFSGAMLEALCMRTPPGELAATLDDVLRNQKVPNHLWDIVTRGFRRLGKAEALPLLKKLAADKPDLAQRAAGIAAAVQLPDLDPRPEAQAAKE